MDEAAKSLLTDAGIDLEDALARFMGSEELLMKFLLRFPDDENYAILNRAMEQGDLTEAFRAAHSLKGVTGNLSMGPLYRAVCELVEVLRRGDPVAGAERMTAVRAAYEPVAAALNQLH